MRHVNGDSAAILRRIHDRLGVCRTHIYTHRLPIKRIHCCVTGRGKGPERAPKSGWTPFHVLDRWGASDQTTWFRLRVTIPREMRNQPVVALIQPSDWPTAGLGGECLAYVEGKPVHGIDRFRGELLLAREAKSGDRFEILLEGAPDGDSERGYVFARAEFAVRIEGLWDFYWDARVVLETVEALDPGFAPRGQLIELLNEALVQSEPVRPDDKAYAKTLEKAQKFLRKGLKTFETSYGVGALTVCGSAAIESRIPALRRELKRSVGRVFSTALDLLERHPEFHFAHAQALHYEWTKAHYPELFEGIGKRVKEGRWELLGGTWVEPDPAGPSGESLIRQFLYGNRWFDAAFGKRSRVAWLRGGYGMWQLPQILHKCQIHSVVFEGTPGADVPFNFFHWEGADGTRIPAIITRMEEGNECNPKFALEYWNAFRQHEHFEEIPFPVGCDSTGPTPAALERAQRLQNMAGIPRCSFGGMDACVQRMVKHRRPDNLPVYGDELGFREPVRRQTSRTRLLRHTETALRNAEFLSGLAMLHASEYPTEVVDAAWKAVLTSQSRHVADNAPIPSVQAEWARDMETADRLAAQARQHAIEVLLDRIDTRCEEGIPIVVFNTLSWVRGGLVEIDTEHAFGNVALVNAQNELLPHQKLDTNRILFEAEDVPPLGYAVYRLAKTTLRANPSGVLTASPRYMENEFFRVEFDSKGAIARIWDKLEYREVLPQGRRANELHVCSSDGDGERGHTEPEPADSIDVIEEGPVRAVVRIIRKTERSTITQRVTLYAAKPRIDFVTYVDWHETGTILKAAFPVDVRASHASFEIQFGAIQRPNHPNRSDASTPGEVPAQRWADLSEGDYGVSLLNDGPCTYDVADNVLRLTLIGVHGEADHGEHAFTYSLVPHAYTWRDTTVQEAADLNNPLFAEVAAASEGVLPPSYAFALVDCENVILDTIKKHEDSDALILRFYEAYGQRCRANVMFAQPPKKATACDMMEENDQPAQLIENSLQFFIKPFEIRTFKVTF